MSNFPQYQVIEIITVEAVQLPNEVIASGVTAFVLEQQTLATSSWSSATYSGYNVNALQAYNNPADAKNFYIVGFPWPNIAAAQAAAVSDFNQVTAIRNGAVTQSQLSAAIGTSSFVNLITTVAGPG